MWQWPLWLGVEFRDLACRDSLGIVVLDDIVECLVPNIPGCVFNNAVCTMQFASGAGAAVTEGPSDSTPEFAACFLPGLQYVVGI
jgi:hypothetical protein